jgi:hypothetical protein
MPDSVSVDPLIGTEVAGYRIEAVLRRDDSGESFLCGVQAGGGRVVVRTFARTSSAAAVSPPRIERICDELSEPADNALVSIRECRTDRDRFIVVRDWVDGCDLKASAGEGRTLSLTVAIDVVSQAARGLDAARWAHGVVHGNLKPQNILLEPQLDGDGSAVIRVVDFGFWSSTRETLEPGSKERARQLAYLAPELVGGDEPTVSSDQYALACVLYECLVGQPPFAGRDAMVDAHVDECPASIRERRPDVPQAVDEAIRRALAVKPEERFTSSSEFAAALSAAQPAGVAAPALPVPASNATEMNSSGAVEHAFEQRRSWSNRRAVSALAVAAVAAAVVVALLVVTDRGGPGSEAAESFPDGRDLDAATIESGAGASRGAALSWTRVTREGGVFDAEGNQVIRGVTRGGPGLVAVGVDGARAAVWTSVDGASWSRAPHDEAVFGGERFQRMRAVSAGPAGLVAVGSDGTDAAVWRSVDGLVWSRVIHDASSVLGGSGTQGMRAVTVGGPGLVAVGFDTSRAGIDAAAWTSVDGSTWARVSHDDAVFGMEENQTMRSVTVGGPGLVAVGSDGTDAAVWTSVDGATWSRVPDPDRVLGPEGNQEMRSVTAGGPGLVAVGLDAVDAEVWTSIDGTTWSTVPDDVAAAVFGSTDSPGARMNSVTTGGPGFVAAGSQTGSGAAVWTSVDGITWLRVPDDGEALGAGGGELMTGVAASGSALIAVGRNGTNAGVWTSGGALAPLAVEQPELPTAGAPLKIIEGDVEIRAGGEEWGAAPSLGTVASIDRATGRISAAVSNPGLLRWN